MKNRESKAGADFPEWIESLRSLLRPEFVEVSGKVFQVWNEAGAQACRSRYTSRSPVTADENTDNHEHFWYFDGTTPEGVNRNYLLAEVVSLAWAGILAQRFPGKRFRLFVSNEYSVDGVASEGGETGIDTVLRLWSIDPATEEAFDACYQPDSVSSGTVLWTQFPEKGLRPISDMLAIIRKGNAHPEYREAIERLRRSHAI
jgi:hypothetical protein